MLLLTGAVGVSDVAWSDALSASGFTGEGREAARSQFEARLKPVVAAVKRIPEKAARRRAEALLAELHGTLLRRYDAEATTLADVLRDGRFNCVSSALLYSLAADAVGLSTRAELFPTHARSLTRVGGRWVPVETTSANGVDPSASEIVEISQRYAPGDAPPGPVRGTQTSSRVLVAAVYINRASLALLGRRPHEAEALFARGVDFADDPSLRQQLIRLRASSISQVVVEDIRKGDRAALRRALTNAGVAVEWASEDPELRALSLQNHRAALSRWLQRAVEEEDAEALGSALTLVDAMGGPEEHRRALAATVYLYQAVAASNAGEWAQAVEKIDVARRLGLPPSEARLLRSLDDLDRAARQNLAVELANQGSIDRALQSVEALNLGPTERSRLWAAAGYRSLHQERWSVAEQQLGRCLQLDPNQATCARNLKVSTERQALAASDRGDCDALDRVLSRSLVRDSAWRFPRQARARCRLRAAERWLESDRPEAALQQLEQVWALRSDFPTIAEQAEYAVRRWVRREPEQCPRMRRVLEPFRRSKPIVDVDAWLSECPPTP